mmetsp:Transcript_13201/g.37652  ORF Transcript_13201/g.37652 Transcript_13201/m.37652 type:complete len:96 (-) Transcript_13201:747-1034(-)
MTQGVTDAILPSISATVPKHVAPRLGACDGIAHILAQEEDNVTKCAQCRRFSLARRDCGTPSRRHPVVEKLVSDKPDVMSSDKSDVPMTAPMTYS